MIPGPSPAHRDYDKTSLDAHSAGVSATIHRYILARKREITRLRIQIEEPCELKMKVIPQELDPSENIMFSNPQGIQKNVEAWNYTQKVTSIFVKSPMPPSPDGKYDEMDVWKLTRFKKKGLMTLSITRDGLKCDEEEVPTRDEWAYARPMVKLLKKSGISANYHLFIIKKIPTMGNLFSLCNENRLLCPQKFIKSFSVENNPHLLEILKNVMNQINRVLQTSNQLYKQIGQGFKIPPTSIFPDWSIMFYKTENSVMGI